jgi:hypothetical protein
MEDLVSGSASTMIAFQAILERYVSFLNLHFGQDWSLHTLQLYATVARTLQEQV